MSGPRAWGPAADPMTRWITVPVAVAGLVLSGFLAYQSLTQTALPGCGSGSACDQVLASRWSLWWGVPVALPAVGWWALILFAVVLGWRRVALTAALTAAGAAVWFVYVQLTRVGQVCPWCMAAHAAAIVMLIVLMARRRTVPWAQLAPALGLVLVLMLGQLLGDAAAPRHRVVTHGSVAIDVSRYPVLGDRDAEHVLIFFFDYTCPHCRVMHGYLDQARQRYGDRLAIALAPAPLGAACNPYVQETEPIHRDACGLAQTAVAVWLADPAELGAIDGWLAGGGEARSLEAARTHARALVGPGLETALADPRVGRLIDAQCRLNFLIGQESGVGDTLPKLVLGTGDILVGKPASAQALLDDLAVFLSDAPPPEVFPRATDPEVCPPGSFPTPPSPSALPTTEPSLTPTSEFFVDALCLSFPPVTVPR